MQQGPGIGAEPQQECSQTLLQHSDYVTALAAAPDVAALASAGLRGEAYIWDVLTAGQARLPHLPCSCHQNHSLQSSHTA